MSNIEPTPFGDKYLLVEHIATGGMAEVYRAQYTGIEGFAKELVVKRLREEFVERPDIIRMFLDEARVAATLTHNNVVHTYDLGELHGEYFIAMELLVGEELVAVLRRAVTTGHMLPMDLALAIMMQALEGLNYAHARTTENGELLGLVHRDINPTNIHVGYDGLVKIVDFGIAATRATAVANASGKGGPGQFAGKLSYMAPEQILGEDLDGRADIFAVGVILYEMCLGRRLFRGNPGEVRNRILTGDVPAPTFVDPDFPPELEAIIMRALEIDRNDRYQNCDHMYRELDAFAQEYGLSASARRISAFMNEMFGEGAPAEVNYDDQYDDLGDEALDFDQYDSLGGNDDEQPDWAKTLDASTSTGDAQAPRRRSMTLGNLEELVATMKKDGPDDSGVHRRDTGSSAVAQGGSFGGSGPSPQATDTDSHAAPRVSESSSSKSRPSRSGSASRSGPARTRAPSRSSAPVSGRHTLSTTALEAGVTGSFGQGVVSEQTKRGNPLVWIALVVILAALVYFGYTILTAK